MDKVKQKYIFDLDGTLLDGDFRKENEYFKSELTKEESEILIPIKLDLLMDYEKEFIRYDVFLLSEYLSKRTSINITPKFIQGWIDFNGSYMEDTIIDGVVDTLEELKSSGKSLVVLTNWFSKGQLGRLKNSGLDVYFDEIYGGEVFLKPNRNSFLNACGDTPLESCVMIGDDYYKDYLGSRQSGIDAIHFDRKERNLSDNNAIKSLRKIKELY